MMSNKGFMRINELEKRAGVPRTTIHFYMRQGLLHPPVKSGRTMAYYDESHLKRLQNIQKIKAAGRMPLSFLKESLAELEERDGENRDSHEPAAREITNTTKAKDKKRQEIVNAAIKVFSEKGYQKVKVRDITASLGISTGTFYIYFEDKKELFVDVVDAVIRAIIGDAREALKQEENIVKRLSIRGRIFYENYLKYNEILNQLRAEMVGEDQWPHEKIKKAYHALTQPVIRDIEKGIEEGIFRKIDPDLTAYTLTGIIEIMCLRTTISGKYTYEQIEPFIFDFITNGFILDK
ncbi:MerR family transcriptional regulator [Desulforhabdus amnigena]|nr:TetR family transcriptional regulator [Desulforhabdus amnigena]NLJ29665.1 TetR family transcriptional regulator [Deltaproteobacteria bacterium]